MTKVTLDFEVYQQVRGALAQANALVQIVAERERRAKKSTMNIHGIEDTLGEIELARHLVRNAYLRGLDDEVAREHEARREKVRVLVGEESSQKVTDEMIDSDLKDADAYAAGLDVPWDREQHAAFLILHRIRTVG